MGHSQPKDYPHYPHRYFATILDLSGNEKEWSITREIYEALYTNFKDKQPVKITWELEQKKTVLQRLDRHGILRSRLLEAIQLIRQRIAPTT